MGKETILILGGTREAAALAKQLFEAGHDVTTSLAGRTREPAPLAGQTRTGGFGGAPGLAKWVRDHGVTRLIDATHPFAEQISRNAREAALIANVTLDVRIREPWREQAGDLWILTGSLEEAAETIPASARVLLALGSQHLDAFFNRIDVHFVVRMVDKPTKPLSFDHHTLILGRPSADWEKEAELLQRENVTHIICRNSGGEGAYAKIKAARVLQLPVIMVMRGT